MSETDQAALHLACSLFNPLSTPESTPLDETWNSELFKNVSKLKFSQLMRNSASHFADSRAKDLNFLLRTLVWVSVQSKSKKLEDSFHEMLSLLAQKDKSTLIAFLYLVQGLLLKENWVGPFFLKKSVDSKLKEDQPEEIKSARLAKYFFPVSWTDLSRELSKVLGAPSDEIDQISYLDFKSEKFISDQNDKFRTELNANGEELIGGYKLLTVFYFYLSAIRHLEASPFEKELSFAFLRARVSYMWTHMLNNPAADVKKLTEESYSALLAREELASPLFAKNKSLLKLEYAILILHYYQYEQSNELIQQAMEELGVTVSLTGKVGVKTKYQTFKVAQLIAEVKTAEESKAEETLPSDSPNDKVPDVKQLDQILDNILYEKPKLENEVEEAQSLSIEVHACLSALLKHLNKSSPMDDIVREKSIAYLSKIIDSIKNWSVGISALILRSAFEIKMPKRMDRAVMQLEQIYKDYEAKDPELADRTRFLFALSMKSYFENTIETADIYASIGWYTTAAEFFKELNIPESAFEYLSISHPDKALEYLETLPAAIKRTPKMLCVLGDLKKDPELYKEAWELSNHRSVRAIRSIGRDFFNKKQYDQSLEAYRKAVALNDFQLNVWSNMGFIHMSRNEYEKGIACYHKVVGIDEQQWKAWTNIAAMQRNLTQPKKAFAAVSEAVKFAERNWQVWFNYTVMAIDAENFGSFLRGMGKLIALDHAEAISDFMLAKLVEIQLKWLEDLEANNDLHRSVGFQMKRCLDLFKDFSPHKHKDLFFWPIYVQIIDGALVFLAKKDEILKKVETKEEFDFEMENRGMMTLKYETLMNHAYAMMKVGWNLEAETSKKVTEVLERVRKFVSENKQWLAEHARILTELDLQIKSALPVEK